MSKFSKINEEQGLYMLEEGNGFSCLGFEVALRWGRGVAEWCGCPEPSAKMAGTPEGYADYERIMEAGRTHAQKTRTRCPALLVPELIPFEHQRVEVVNCWGETRRFWVGKSTGWLPIHLEILTTRSIGGSGTVGAPFKSVRLIRSR